MSTRLSLVLSCEHGGNEIPAAYRHLFAGHGALLASHRGWDPGTLELATALSSHLGAPLVTTTVSRLLVDTNRSAGHRQAFSEITRGLEPEAKEQILARHHAPHRRRVAREVARKIEAGRRVFHLGVHSFTPMLEGEVRNFDVGWLYDPRRRPEKQLAADLIAALAARRGDLRQRRNAPYLGRADGLTTSLRRHFPPAAYLGLELEVNQKYALAEGPAWQRWIDDLCHSIESVLIEGRRTLL